MNGDIANKKDVLLAIGQNPLLTEREISLAPYEWHIPVGESAKGIRAVLEKVRTKPQQMKKASEDASSLKWCGWRESNSRILLGRQV